MTEPIGGKFNVVLHDGGVLVVNLTGTIDNKLAYDVERSIKNYEKRVSHIEGIIFSMGNAQTLSSKAIDILVDWKKKKETWYYQVPDFVKKQMYNEEILSDFKTREGNQKTLSELVIAVQKYLEGQGDARV